MQPSRRVTQHLAGLLGFVPQPNLQFSLTEPYCPPTYLITELPVKFYAKNTFYLEILLNHFIVLLSDSRKVKFSKRCALMPRKKRTSAVLEKTEQQIIGFQSIDPSLNFGDAISLKHLTELNGQLRDQVNQYNMMLTALDSAREKIETLEKSIRETSERLVSGVALKHGKDSREYEMTGAVRKSDRIRKATITRLKSTVVSKAAS